MIFPSASSVLLAAVDGTLTRRLLTDTELAWQIDNVSPPSVRRSATASGYRRFFWTPSHRSPAHITTLMRLTAGITRRVSQTPFRSSTPRSSTPQPNADIQSTRTSDWRSTAPTRAQTT
ncbi:hypothetical protein DPSP01_010005 [Paraphaeosphaeria sporulosa]